MGNAKVSKDFSTTRYTDQDVSSKAGYIVDKMTGNAAFVTPEPPLADITDARDNYVVFLDKVVYGRKEDTVTKNNLRKELVDILKEEADYVQSVSKGDEAIILSSGFDVCKKAAPVGPLAKPESVIVRQGENKGTLWIISSVVNNASMYMFEFTETPVTATSVWIQRSNTKHKMLIEGLTSGKQYTFRVAAAGSDPSRIWSEEVTSYVI